MSSYLLAIAIGHFGSMSGKTKSGVSVRVWASVGYEVYGEVALLAAIETIDYLSKELEQEYIEFNTKLGKLFYLSHMLLFICFLDILAAPEYAGAMENVTLYLSIRSI